MKHIMRCVVCNSYTMKSEHCGKKTVQTKPAKYSPEDKWAEWRRRARKEQIS